MIDELPERIRIQADACGSLTVAPGPPETTLLIVRGFGPPASPAVVPGAKLAGVRLTSALPGVGLSAGS